MAETRWRIAARQAAGSLPWIGGRSVRRTAIASRSRDQSARNRQLPAWQLEKLWGADDPQHALQKTEAWQTCGTRMTATSCVTQSWCRLSCREFDVANARVGTERNPRKTEVYFVNDLDAAPPERRIRDAEHGRSHRSHRSAQPLEWLSDPKACHSFEQYTNAFSYARTRRQNLLSCGKSGR